MLCNTCLQKNICELSITIGAIRCIVSEGMPIHRNPFEKGNLYIKFEITFPPNKFTDPDQLKVMVEYNIFLNFVCVLYIRPAWKRFQVSFKASKLISDESGNI